MARKRKPTDEVQLKLRFTEALRLDIEKSAASHGRSLNGEIIYLLNQALYRGGTLEVIDRLNKIESQLRVFNSLGANVFRKLASKPKDESK